MEYNNYSEDDIKNIPAKVRELIGIVRDLEKTFPGRNFTLDGHLVGSIGEVVAAYHYGIQLLPASSKDHDGIWKDRCVQIKITQQDNIVISHLPQYLIVLYLCSDGRIYEVYNGPGKKAWDTASKKDSHNYRYMRVNKLIELDQTVFEEQRISAIHPIDKMKKEYKNPRKKKLG